MFAILETLRPTATAIAHNVPHLTARVVSLSLTVAIYVIDSGQVAYTLGRDFAESEKGQAIRRGVNATVKRGLAASGRALISLSDRIQ